MPGGCVTGDASDAADTPVDNKDAVVEVVQWDAGEEGEGRGRGCCVVILAATSSFFVTRVFSSSSLSSSLLVVVASLMILMPSPNICRNEDEDEDIVGKRLLLLPLESSSSSSQVRLVTEDVPLLFVFRTYSAAEDGPRLLLLPRWLRRLRL